MSECAKNKGLMGREVTGKPVTSCADLNEVFSGSLPAFGGAYLRRVYEVMKQVIEKRIPLVVTCAGPITVSDQHRAWLIPLLRAANTAYITVTDAICYHDGHDCLRKSDERPIREVALFGDDAKLRENGVIRVTDTGFDEQVLFDQDAVLTEVLQRPEFQKRMTTTERNYLLGKYYAEREGALGADLDQRLLRSDDPQVGVYPLGGDVAARQTGHARVARCYHHLGRGRQRCRQCVLAPAATYYADPHGQAKRMIWSRPGPTPT